MSDELLKLRNEIDRIDEEILARLAERARCAQRVGEIKRGVMYYRPEREAQVLRRLAELNPGPLSADAVKTIFREVMSACLGLEQPLRVAYLGPAGTFSESASRKHFGSAPNLLPMAAIDDVFRAVEAGNADYGVVPVENSTEGAVGGTLDLLLANPLKVCGEVRLRIHQQLMSRAEGIGAARRIYSHAQSLAQCHEWLNRNLPHLPRIPVASNAEAARMASEDPESCAIAGEAAAQLYGLNILAPNIEDDPNNTTRFLVIADHDAGPSGKDRTSLVFSAPNRPGAIHSLLEPMARHGVDMTKLQSRPARSGLWEYVFYADINGHRDDPEVAAALRELDERAAFVKIIGSYPVAAI
ncbi:prephenate dehydratase [Thauera phenylacetica]|uniref:Bifunctional chorismate mutase/prephenate dehydratase n=1 Tax=Thauera phenylacetica B4P TaxID=1234382 RepID=N6ZSK1_9RHOO|nr:prephenate dehydratase [Thauera phenylacetica]ENO97298.1 chorismate mutase [Thauera phenylacetica B4P]RTL23510.1 MAG: prephenate dehydratase [Rhodocyclaceae bacterium]